MKTTIYFRIADFISGGRLSRLEANQQVLLDELDKFQTALDSLQEQGFFRDNTGISALARQAMTLDSVEGWQKVFKACRERSGQLDLQLKRRAELDWQEAEEGAWHGTPSARQLREEIELYNLLAHQAAFRACAIQCPQESGYLCQGGDQSSHGAESTH